MRCPARPLAPMKINIGTMAATELDRIPRCRGKSVTRVSRGSREAGCSAAWLARLLWEQEAAGSNPAIPTGSSYFPNLESIALKALWELFVPGWTSADVAKRCPLLVHVDSHLFGHRAWVLFSAARLAKQLLWAADVLPSFRWRACGCRSRRDIGGTVSLQDPDGRTSTSRSCRVPCVGSMMVRAATTT